MFLNLNTFNVKEGINYEKFLCTLLSAAVVLGSAGVSVAAKEDISVTLNGRYISFDQPPIMQNDRTLVPMRAIFEALGATVSYIYTTNDIYKYDYVTYQNVGKVTSQKQDKKGSYISIPKDSYVDFTNKADTDVTIKIPTLYTSYEMQ